jgi:hypothetical protein
MMIRREIGAGSGSFNQEQAKALMLDEMTTLDVPMTLRPMVRHRSNRRQLRISFRLSQYIHQIGCIPNSGVLHHPNEVGIN